MKKMNENPINMVNITSKENVFRSATASGKIMLRKATIKSIRESGIKKGDPLTVGEIAAILAVKNTPMFIPLCHNIPIGKVDVVYRLSEKFIDAECTVITNSQTGVEMEALMGVTIALLNIWDMTKYLEKDEKGQYPDTVITDIKIIEKRKEA
jgi:cyclic pyranopterin phosphate synthase